VHRPPMGTAVCLSVVTDESPAHSSGNGSGIGSGNGVAPGVGSGVSVGAPGNGQPGAAAPGGRREGVPLKQRPNGQHGLCCRRPPASPGRTGGQLGPSPAPQSSATAAGPRCHLEPSLCHPWALCEWPKLQCMYRHGGSRVHVSFYSTLIMKSKSHRSCAAGPGAPHSYRVTNWHLPDLSLAAVTSGEWRALQSPPADWTACARSPPCHRLVPHFSRRPCGSLLCACPCACACACAVCLCLVCAALGQALRPPHEPHRSVVRGAAGLRAPRGAGAQRYHLQFPLSGRYCTPLEHENTCTAPRGPEGPWIVPGVPCEVMQAGFETKVPFFFFFFQTSRDPHSRPSTPLWSLLLPLPCLLGSSLPVHDVPERGHVQPGGGRTRAQEPRRQGRGGGGCRGRGHRERGLKPRGTGGWENGYLTTGHEPCPGLGCGHPLRPCTPDSTRTDAGCSVVYLKSHSFRVAARTGPSSGGPACSGGAFCSAVAEHLWGAGLTAAKGQRLRARYSSSSPSPLDLSADAGLPGGGQRNAAGAGHGRGAAGMLAQVAGPSLLRAMGCQPQAFGPALESLRIRARSPVRCLIAVTVTVQYEGVIPYGDTTVQYLTAEQLVNWCIVHPGGTCP